MRQVEGGALYVEGFPDAVKLIRLDGPKAKRLAHLVLHRWDLAFALECLDGITSLPDEAQEDIRQGLWRFAIINLMKCYGSHKSRFSLNAKNVFKGKRNGKEVFQFFHSLRDKHLVHDENVFAQCAPSAVLNKPGLPWKIAKIVCLRIQREVLSQDAFNNLRLLITESLNWVVKEFDALANDLTSELEGATYEELLSRDPVSCTTASIQDVEKQR